MHEGNKIKKSKKSNQKIISPIAHPSTLNGVLWRTEKKMKERGSVVFEKKRLEGDTTEIKNGYKTKNKRAQKGF